MYGHFLHNETNRIDAQTPVAVASSFVFDTSKFGGKHPPRQQPEKSSAAKRALREATL